MTISTEYLTVSEVSKIIGVCVRRVYQYIAEGSLKATRFGNRVHVITRADLNQFLREIPDRRLARGVDPVTGKQPERNILCKTNGR
jgi:excisionase family DNA binding protein